MITGFSNYRDGKKDFQSVSKKGNVMGVCSTFNRKYLCCNVHVIRTIQNCPFECSYCFLQNYLTDGITKSVSDIPMVMRKVRSRTGTQPRRLFRIGTWELGDSLALETRTGQASRLVQEFAGMNNAILERMSELIIRSIDTVFASVSGRGEKIRLSKPLALPRDGPVIVPEHPLPSFKCA